MIKIFIGTSGVDDEKASQVLSYTLTKHASEELDITYMSPDNMGQWNSNTWGTPFSGFRWAIPSICGFKGKAIYIDVDMVCFHDIADLWNTDMGDNAILIRRVNAGNESSLMLIDCEKAAQYIPSLDELKTMPNINSTMHNKLKHVGYYDPTWNVLDGENYDIGSMKVLHYTRRESQPWQPKWWKGRKEGHKRPELVKLWHDLYDESQKYMYINH
jgi:hypothetical protein